MLYNYFQLRIVCNAVIYQVFSLLFLLYVTLNNKLFFVLNSILNHADTLTLTYIRICEMIHFVIVHTQGITHFAFHT